MQDDLPYKVWLRDKWYRLTRMFGTPLTYVLAILVVGIIGIIVLFILFLIAGLMWYVSPLINGKTRSGLSITERKELVQGFASVAQAAAVALTGAAGFIGLAFTWRNLRQTRESTQETLRLTEQGQITDRFTSAIDQLGKTDDNDKKIGEIRLGGIYALAQIAVEDPKEYHWTIMQIFADYLQTYASWDGDRLVEPEADIRAILNVLGRRDRSNDPEGESLLLAELDLSQYFFPAEAHLEKAVLVSTHLESADLGGAFLQGADFRGANLQGANLAGADLSSADLRSANLEGAYLYDANLKDADLGGAYLNGTYLPGAKLLEAKNLDPESLQQANGQTHSSWATQVAQDIRPSWWTKLPHDEIWEQEQARKQLDPGEYSIKVSRTPLYFSVGEGWYATLNLPYGISLTRTGTVFMGSVLGFRSHRWVCDPQKPSERYAHKLADKDMLKWFLDHPCLDNKNQKTYKLGGVSAVQFDAEVSTSDDKLLTFSGSPALPLFPARPRWEPFVLLAGNKHRILVLTRQDESMVITIESRPEAFDVFHELVQEVLATVYWGDNPGEQPEGA